MQILRRAPNREISGLRLEIIGLFLLLAAAIWQAGFTDWFEKNNTEWQYYIQEDINIAVLANLKNLASMTANRDGKELMQQWEEIDQRTGNAISKAIVERDRRNALQKGQASFFKIVRLIMGISGALLIIIGKYNVFAHKANSARGS
jgi:hypothetical protein